jgi:hypothetical protein
MQKPSSKGTYIAVIIIVLVAAGLYFYYQGVPNDSAISSLESSASPGSSDAQAIGNRVLILLNQINSLKIDESLFNSTAYKSLVDYTITVPQQNVGRPNPFAPIAGSVPPPSAARSSGSAR